MAIGHAVLLAWAAPASAFEGYPGIRPLGMGGASRAWAVGDAGPLLNPSGMSLLRTYTVEGAYAYGRRFTENFFHGSIVDNTSTFGIAGGLYYTYHMAQPTGAGGTTTRGHEGGFALSLPFGERVAIGATVKYFRLQGIDAAGSVDGKDDGVTFDIGATAHPTQVLTLALVGTNLYDVKNGQAPQSIAYGAALIPTPGLLVAVDGRTAFTANNYTGRKGTSVMAGGEFTFAQRVSVRAGGGYDASTGSGYLTAGASLLSEAGAADVGFWQDVSQAENAAGVQLVRQTVIGVSLRLFIPANQTQPQ